MSRWRAAILAFALAIWASSLTAQFTFDDRMSIVENEWVTGPLSLRSLFTHDFWGYPFGRPDAPGSFRPVVTLTFWIDWHLGGGKPWIFHLSNLLWFVATLVVADRFLARLAPDTSENARLIGVAAFACIGIHVDVVPSATGRAELLAMVFALLACELALKRDKRPRDVALVFVFLLLALLSKESTVPMGLFAAWLAWRRRHESSLRATTGVIVAGLVAVVAMFAFRTAMHLPLQHAREEFQFANPLSVAGPGLRFHGALQALGHYVEHLVAPVDLCPDYSYGAIVPRASVTHATVVGALTVLALVATLVLLRKLPAAVDSVVGFAATYVVMSNVLMPASAFVADRVFFFPSFFLVALIAIVLAHVVPSRSRVLVAIGAGGVILLQAAVSAIGATVWHDDARLASWGVRACPTNFLLRHMRSVTANELDQYDEAAWALLVGADIFPRFPAPIAADEFPSSWEDEPVARRVELLRAARGERFEAICGSAFRLARNTGYKKGTVAAVVGFCRPAK